MRILVNTAHQRFGGGVQVALSFINELKQNTNHNFAIWLGPGLAPLLDVNSFPQNFSFRYYDFGLIRFSTALKINRQLKADEKAWKPDVIISTTGPTYFNSKAPQIIGYNLGLYLYPESPYHSLVGFKSMVHFRLRKLAHFSYFRRDASAIVVQTDDVNKRVRRALNFAKVYTVTNTASEYYRKPKSFKNKLPNPQGSFRFLTVSAYYIHKNLELIPEISKELKRRGINNVEFVLTLNNAEFNKVNKNDLSIITVGPIKPVECPSLYNECDAMLLPTLAECFSAAYPEAMLMEKPIITTDLGFARSICGEAALYYEAMNPISAANQIEKLINDEVLQKSLVLKGKVQINNFDSPRQRANKYLQLCEQIAVESELSI